MLISPGVGEKNSEVFKIEIMGHFNSSWSTLSHNYVTNGTETSAVTVLFPPQIAYQQLAFRLSYSGDQDAKITAMSLWQELAYHSASWNYTPPMPVTPPEADLQKGGTYDFLVDSPINGKFLQGDEMVQSTFYFSLETSLGDYVVTADSTSRTIELTTWPLTSLSSIISPGLPVLIAIFTYCMLLLRTRRRKM